MLHFLFSIVRGPVGAVQDMSGARHAAVFVAHVRLGNFGASAPRL